MFFCIKSSLLPIVPSAPRKMVRAPIEIINVIPDELHLFEQKDRIEDIDNIPQKLKPGDVNNISFIVYKCNEKLIIQSINFLVQLAVPRFNYK